ncbi:predicted protein [Nematostella vectensis]|uniref:Major facilitator superfamily associated domain-containing protein n=1 Tax=Nematostella vectensis TaxID=45351 RepID=A7RI08_NEMVE|nr:major facilitator superfamily domain-containing protein 6 [Nematostella vectensis]EDO49068.1 predicted protein [Nematostella vectensis]|eukprot:XP_001641131.1 predicted protein [Nematostella vectensis]
MVNKQAEAIEKDPIIQSLERSSSLVILNQLRRFTRCLLDPDLLAAKAFCFFLYGACGALLPYLPLYLKQFGIHAYQVGIILGIGPVVQCLGAPAWAAVANKWRIGKFIFLSGILSWLVKGLLILAVHPRAQVCIQSYKNTTTNITYVHAYHLWKNKLSNTEKQWRAVYPKPTVPPKFVSTTTVHRTSANPNQNSSIPANRTILEDVLGDDDYYGDIFDGKDNLGSLQKTRRLMAVVPHHVLINQIYTNRESKLQTTKFSKSLNVTVMNEVQIDRQELNDIFLIILLFVLIGDFLQSSTFTLADASVLNRLDEDHRESPTGMRIAGCLGSMIAVILVGTIIYDSKYDLCGAPRALYYVAFYFFIGFMCMAFVNSLWFQFSYHDDRGCGSVLKVISLFTNREDSAFLVCVLYVGLCYGFLSHFLFWFVDDLGGHTLIMGTASALRELTALVFFFVGDRLLPLVGQTNVMVMTLLCYSACFFTAWRLTTDLWIIVALGVVEGATFASFWRCCEKYFAYLGTPKKIIDSTQSFLQAVFWGLGNGGGAMVGGSLITQFGARTTFGAFGVTSLVVCLLYVIYCYVLSELSKESSGDDTSSDDDQ